MTRKRQENRIKAKDDTRPIFNVRNGNQHVHCGDKGIGQYRKTKRKCNNCGVEKVTSNNSCKKYKDNLKIYCGTMRVMDKKRFSKKLGKIS